MQRTMIGVALLGALSLGCAQGRKSAAGFHMPDGDPTRGEAVFADLKCHSCHEVTGANHPAPVADPPVPVVLGGQVHRQRTDGELAAAIVDPSHWIATPALSEVRSGKLSRMGDFSESMTVRDLVDVVAYLQSRYEVVAPPPPMH